jgi:mannose-6-phosphate isomerase
MYQMRNPIRHYDWGSTEAIPELLGVTPDGRPQAELWMGAYESESSLVRIDRRWHDLAAVLRARGEPRLPFLAKVTAIGAPLSLQIHPATGPEAKAEMLYAWHPCRVLCGFRDAATVRTLLADLRGAAADREVAGIAGSLVERTDYQDALRDCLGRLLAIDGEQVTAVRDALRRLPRWRSVASAVDELAAHHPTDPAVLAPMLLAEFTLAPGEAIVCRPGQPHTYLSGVGIEVQSNSDAVVRAGLTSKPVDRDAFLAGAITRTGAARVTPHARGPERVYAPEGINVAIGVVGDIVDGSTPLGDGVAGPQILLCVEGGYAVRQGTVALELHHGESAFVPGSAVDVAVRGKGCLVRVSTGRTGQSTGPT